MPEKGSSGRSDNNEPFLRGTTYRVYVYIMKQGSPVSVSQVQKGLGLSSSSVSQYHIQKLLRFGLVKEEGLGYVVDRLVLDNMIRFRRRSIPVQSAYVAFFSASLFILLIFIRPNAIDSDYVFALLVTTVGLIIGVYETVKTLRRY